MFLFNLLPSRTIIYILSFFKPQELIDLYDRYKIQYGCKGDIVDDKIFSILYQDSFWINRCREDFCCFGAYNIMTSGGTYQNDYETLYECWKDNLLVDIKTNPDLASTLRAFHLMNYNDKFFQNIVVRDYTDICLGSLNLIPENILLIDDLLNFHVPMLNGHSHKHIDKIYFPKLLNRLKCSGTNMIKVKSELLYYIMIGENSNKDGIRFGIVCESMVPDLADLKEVIPNSSTYYVVINNIIVNNDFQNLLNIMITGLNVIPDDIRSKVIRKIIGGFVWNEYIDNSCQRTIYINRLLFHKDLKYTEIGEMDFSDHSMRDSVNAEVAEILVKYSALRNK